MDTFFGILYEDTTRTSVDSVASLDMWGVCTRRNFHKIVRRNRCLKPLRVYLLKLVLELCESANVETLVYGGTALAVYREGGKMIAHDTDIDLATMEYDDRGIGSFTKLLMYCDSHGILYHGVHHQNESKQHMISSHLRLDFASSISGMNWLSKNCDLPTEIPYSGHDCKRVKCFLTESGLRSACDELKLSNNVFLNVMSDPSVVHVDLFTLSYHPDFPNSHLRVNWNIPGVYDCMRKRFPVTSIFPTQSAVFEGINVKAPANLALYLTTEYEYIGRDAIYDHERQAYVQSSSIVECDRLSS